MEAFGLYNVALDDNKEATCIVSISDSLFEENVDLTSEERQTSLNEMIILALESIIKELRQKAQACLFNQLILLFFPEPY